MDGDVERITVHVDPDLEDLIPIFLENRRKDITAMLDALGRGDFDAIRILGHSMKGAGGGYGLDAITDIGRALEDAAKGANANRVGEAIVELSRYLDMVDVVFE